MLIRLGGRGYCVQERAAVFGFEQIDCDPDSDFDSGVTLSRHSADAVFLL